MNHPPPHHPHISSNTRFLQKYLQFDGILLMLLLLLSGSGFLILYAASEQSMAMLNQQGSKFLLGACMFLFLSQLSPDRLRRIAPWLYGLGLVLLILVLGIGHIGKGGQRWINLGLLRFQPSELMKLAIPMTLAWYFHTRPIPLRASHLPATLLLILVPVALTAKQPDLGTAILLFISGAAVLFFAGIPLRWVGLSALALAPLLPLTWYKLYDYQKQRVLIFLNPENDPLKHGYHIIQSKIAIGSGGFWGKGWLNGTQSNLHFLPEHSTDFIFAVCGEELGLFGCSLLIILYLLIVSRGLWITIHAQNTFSRLLAGSITCTFFICFFINMGMVTGILPVVGVPLPFISYGGSSMMTMMASFGILTSIHTHRQLISH